MNIYDEEKYKFELYNDKENIRSTQRNVSNEVPKFPLGKVAGQYCRFPLGTGDIDGGLRLQGKYKKDTDDKPLITYITVVYNRVNTLLRCMESIWSQDYDNIEYIVVDGGSTDGTVDLIKSHEDCIDYFISQKDSGIYNAMNKGISLASGRFLCFINSDDICKAGAARLVVHAYKKQHSMFITGRRELMNDKGIIKEVLLPRYKMQKFVIFPLPIHHQSSYAHRELFDKIGNYDESYKFIADYKWEIACTEHMYFLEEELSVFSLEGATGTANPLDRWSEWSRLCEEVFPKLSFMQAEVLHYSIRHFWQNCEVKTLLKCVRKNLKDTDFAKTLYETCWYICYVELFYMKNMLKNVDENTLGILKNLYKMFEGAGEPIVGIDDILAYIDNLLRCSTEKRNQVYAEKDFDFVSRVKHQANICYHILQTSKIRNKKVRREKEKMYIMNSFVAHSGKWTVLKAKRQFNKRR